jgi:tetratricopeptide (TPR) repeat protein
MAAPGFIAGSFVDGDEKSARMSVQFRCGVEYLGHEPEDHGDSLRIRLDSTQVCTGAAPSIAFNREQHRPIGADAARLVSIEYHGDSPAGKMLRFDFSQDVRFDRVESLNDNTITVHITFDADAPRVEQETASRTSRRVDQAVRVTPRYVINLESSTRPPATADIPALQLDDDTELFVSQAEIDGQTWYRLRVGYFDTADDAARALRALRPQYPSAWIDQAAGTTVPLKRPEAAIIAAAPTESAAASETLAPDSEIVELMRDARRAMIAGEISRAIQIYTKVLQQPPNKHQQDAQEYLALARERNGQLAHAKAEYQRYLSAYPDTEGAARVSQRLAALMAVSDSGQPSTRSVASSGSSRASSGDWRVRTFASQFYRRDANQLNDQDEIISQSSVYTDISIDARRRGERFDFSARLTGGHRYNLLDQPERDDKDVRLSYAYADLADSKTGLRGRLGRQTRNSGGVLGRFDGLNLTWSVTERIELEAVAGKPVYSTADGVDSDRTFYGASAGFGPIFDNVDIRAFVLQQEINGLTDRQAVGGELRYFGETKSFWGLFDYNPDFGDIGSVFLQGSWRLPSNFTITGLFDHRESPYLSLGNAMIGQYVEDFSELQLLYTEDEIRQFAIDRSATTTTVTLGLSRPLTPKVQLGFNATQSSVDETPESGGVLATPASTYSYYSLDLVASSLFSERDVTIFALRYSDSNSSNVYTFNIDSRFPVGRSWRISPRLRVDYRRFTADDSEQWIYTPGLRLEYRWGRKVRFELMAGKQFSTREISSTLDEDRESYYFNAGYQLFF